MNKTYSDPEIQAAQKVANDYESALREYLGIAPGTNAAIQNDVLDRLRDDAPRTAANPRIRRNRHNQKDCI